MQDGGYQIVFFIVLTTILIFLLAGMIISLLYVYQRKQLVFNQNLIHLKHEYEKSILNTQVEIQEQTFQEISREIHDNINLSLTLAKLNLNTLDYKDVSGLGSSVQSSVNILSSVITDLSDLSKGLNTDMIRSLGLMNALKNEIERLQSLAHLNVEYSVKGEPVFMDCERELLVFRIVQEAFNNIIKHANASHVWLKLFYFERHLEMEIQDDGIGFDRQKVENEKKQIAGLINMERRARLFGGQYTLESQLDKGTRICVTVPYQVYE